MAISPSLPEAGSERQSGTQKNRVLVLAALFAGLSVVGGVYSAAKELAVPSGLWMSEYRLFSPANLAIAGQAGALQNRLAAMFPDAGLLVRYAACQGEVENRLAAQDWAAVPAARRNCVTVLDESLRQSPAAPAVWLERAQMLEATEADSDSILQSLAMSFATGPREGWVIERRIPFSLRLWDSLSAELQDHAREDIRVMLQSWELINRLAAVYESAVLERQRIATLVDEVGTPEQKRDFVYVVSGLLKKDAGSAPGG